MREMSLRELRDSLSSIGEIVERDGEMVLTRHGRPLIKLVPLPPAGASHRHELADQGGDALSFG